MPKSFAIFTIALVIYAAVPTGIARTPDPHMQRTNNATQTDQKEWDLLKTRFNSEYGAYLSSRLWSLIHNYSSKEKVDESLDLLMLISEAVSKNNPALLDRVGGLTGCKKRFLGLMNSNDDTVSGYAALVLAVSGDMAYARQIAALLDKKDEDGDEGPITVRGEAATALGILGASEYVSKIVGMLQSRNEYDRSGAATGLAYLGAKEQAPEIVKMMTNEQFSLHDDVSGIHALVQLKVADKYLKEIATLLDEKFRTERAKTAGYALAQLRAKEYAPAIAKLLNDKYKRGDAAKALAIMGATDYASEIAKLLAEGKPLDQQAALLALGVLNAKQYVSEVAKLLKAPEDSVSHAAADALILMEADQYSREAIRIIDHDHQSGPYVSVGEFHPFVKDEVAEINSRYLVSLARLRQRMK